MIDWHTPTVVVLGSVHMDLIATADRLPLRGESVLGNGFMVAPGGKGGNQACQLALAGCRTFMLSRVGNDGFGQQLVSALNARKVDTSLIAIDAKYPTGASTVFAAEGDYCSIISRGAGGHLSAADIEKARPVIESSDGLVLQLEVPVSVSIEAARLARAKNKCVVLNASPAPQNASQLPRELLQSVTVLIVNAVEAQLLLGQPLSATAAATELSKKLAIKTVVVTAGTAGSTACHDGEITHQAAYYAKVVDTVGAGDAYLGTFVTGLLQGLSMRVMMQRAAAAGALAVSRRGAYEAMPNRDEVDAYLQKNGG
jgi:ribokinase